MNNYKFRGKTEHGEWVYGFYIEGLSSYTGDRKYCIVQKDENIGDYTEFTNILPETVGQWTGLTDNKRTKEYPNGQPVFEGDIIKFYNTDDVEYDDDNQEFIRPEICQISKVGNRGLVEGNFLEDYSTTSLDFFSDMGFEYEVIGNIHDNPELLEDNNAK